MEKKLFYQMYPLPWFYKCWNNQTEIKEQGQILPAPKSYGLWEMRDEFEKLKDLGVDVIWLSGALNSPRKDHGYDVMDFKRIDPQVGAMTSESSIYTIHDFIKDTHNIGAKLIIDLVLNHTSTKHEWFLSRREDYYYFLDEPKPNWHNLFDDGSAWKYDVATKKYYCHMFHEDQADLAWFDAQGNINEALVQEFRDIVKFWLDMGVDGFRLDVPQSINKDINLDKLDFGDMLGGSRSKEVINRIFKGYHCLLLMECFDPTYGEISKSYIEETPVQYIMNVLIKGLESDQRRMIHHMSQAVPGFVLDLESHDSCRCLSRPGMTFEDELELLFNSGATNVCLYQGQELGLKNPELSREQMLDLDAQAAMQLAAGKSFESLKDISRANARFPLPEGEYEKQRDSSELTPFKKMQAAIEIWKVCG